MAALRTFFILAVCLLLAHQTFAKTKLPASAPNGTMATTPSSNVTFALALPILLTRMSGRSTSGITGAVTDPLSPSSIQKTWTGWRMCAQAKGGWLTRRTSASAASLSLLSQWGVNQERVASGASERKPNIWSWPVKCWIISACQSILRVTLIIQGQITMPKPARILALKILLLPLKWHGSGCYVAFFYLLLLLINFFIWGTFCSLGSSPEDIWAFTVLDHQHSNCILEGLKFF